MSKPKYPGITQVINGNGAVARVMNMVCGGVIGYPITPSTEISETFEANVAQGQANVWGKHPFFFEPEGEHSAQSGALGAALTGHKFISNASSSQGILYGMESHFVTAGKRIGGFVLHVAARVVARHSLNVMGGHDDVYALLPSGYTTLFGATPEEAADLAAISYRTSSLTLIPVANCMDGFSTSHMMSEARLAEPELIREYLGDPAGYIESPTAAQEVLFGAKGRVFQFGRYLDAHARELPADTVTALRTLLTNEADAVERDADGSFFAERVAPLIAPADLGKWRRQWVNAPAKGTRPLIPALVDVDNPGLTGPVQNQPDFQAGVADHRTHFQADVPRLVHQAMAEYSQLTGREYSPITTYNTDDADVIFVGLGSITQDVLAVMPYLRKQGIKVGLVKVTLLQPFPEAELVAALRGASAVTILERSDQAALTSFVNTAISKACQNARTERYTGIPALAADELPAISSAFFGIGGHDVQPRHLIAAARAMASSEAAPEYYLGSTFFDPDATGELADIQAKLRAAYPATEKMGLLVEPNPAGLLPESAMRIRFHSVGGYGTIATGKLLTDILAELLHMYSKAAPKYGSEKSGAPTNYYITLSPEPVKITNAELEDVEIVVSPDHMAFAHTDPLKGITDGGTFIIQSDQSPQDFWASLPEHARQTIRERHVNLYILDAFAVAKEHAPNESLEVRMMGVAFIGAIVTCVDRIAAGANMGAMLERVNRQLTKKFGAKGTAVVKANMTVVEQGAQHAVRVDYAALDTQAQGDGTAASVRSDTSSDADGAESAVGTGVNSEGTASAGAASLTPSGDADTPARRALPVRNISLSEGMANRGGCSLMQGMFDQSYFQQTVANPFNAGTISEAPVYPGAGLFMPPGSGASKDKGLFRRQVPVFESSLCTGCMECALVCPDAAIPNTVFTLDSLLRVAIKESGDAAAPLAGQTELVHAIAESMRENLKARKDRPQIADIFAEAASSVLGAAQSAQSQPADNAGYTPTTSAVTAPNNASTSTPTNTLDSAHTAGTAAEPTHRFAANTTDSTAVTDPSIATAIAAVTETLHTYPTARTRPFFDAAEKQLTGKGVLFAATVDPWKCTGCLECVSVCSPKALIPTAQTAGVRETTEERFNFLAKLPNSPAEFTDPAGGPNLDLKRIFLDHRNYYSTIGGHGACRGCGEVTAIRQTMALANDINKHRVAKHRADLTELLAALETKAAELAAGVCTDDVSSACGAGDAALTKGVHASDTDVYAAGSAKAGDNAAAADNAYRRELIEKITAILEKRLYRYEGPAGGNGPAGTVVANSTGCSSVYASTAPYNSYQEPWVNGLFQDAQPLAKGIFEGMAADLATDVLAMRQARAILAGAEDDAIPNDAPQWQHFTPDELGLMPAVLTISGDGAAYDIGFGALSRILTSGTPLKMLVLNTGVYSNTGGQASTASLEGQDSDLARFGTYHEGKTEQRKELALLAAMHPHVLAMSTSTSYQAHFLKNVSAALAQTNYPALIDVWTSCQPEHGIGDDEAAEQAKLAVKSRVNPLFVHEPQHDAVPDRFNLAGNPDVLKTWSRNKISYVDADGAAQSLEVPYTPADFAFTEMRFKKNFSKLPSDAPNPVAVADFVELSDEERAGATPFIYVVEANGTLGRRRINHQMVRLTEQCRDHWRLLQYLAGQDLAALRKENADLTKKLNAASALVEAAESAKQTQAASASPHTPEEK